MLSNAPSGDGANRHVAPSAIDLITEEIGEEAFVAIAGDLAAHTFAAQQLPAAATTILRSVFELRARRLVALRLTGNELSRDWQGSDISTAKAAAADELLIFPAEWRPVLGELVYANALADLTNE